LCVNNNNISPPIYLGGDFFERRFMDKKEAPLDKFLSGKVVYYKAPNAPKRDEPPSSYLKKLKKDHNDYVRTNNVGFICSEKQFSKILDRCKKDNLNKTQSSVRVKDFLYLLRTCRFLQHYHLDNDLLPDQHPCKKTSAYESFLFRTQSEAEIMAKKLSLSGYHSTIINQVKFYVPGKHFQELKLIMRGESNE